MDKAITLYSVQERHHPTKDPTSHCLPQARGDLRGAGGCPASAARARSTKSQVAADPQVGQRQKVAGPTATTAAQPGDTAPHGAQQEDETSSGTPRRSRRCPPMALSPSLPAPVPSARGPPAIFAPSLPPAPSGGSGTPTWRHGPAPQQVLCTAGSSLHLSFPPSVLPSAPYLAGQLTLFSRRRYLSTCARLRAPGRHRRGAGLSPAAPGRGGGAAGGGCGGTASFSTFFSSSSSSPGAGSPASVSLSLPR